MHTKPTLQLFCRQLIGPCNPSVDSTAKQSKVTPVGCSVWDAYISSATPMTTLSNLRNTINPQKVHAFGLQNISWDSGMDCHHHHSQGTCAMRLGCRMSPGYPDCTETIITHKVHVLCRQVGRELHELKPALPLFDGVTGQPRTV